MKSIKINKERYKRLQALERKREEGRRLSVYLFDRTYDDPRLKVAFVVVYDEESGDLYGFEETDRFCGESNQVRSSVFRDAAEASGEFAFFENGEAERRFDFYDPKNPN